MAIKDAVAARVLELCRERGIRPNELANRAGVTASTVYSLLDARRRDVSVVTVKKLCDGLDITIGEFFATPEFDALEQEGNTPSRFFVVCTGLHNAKAPLCKGSCQPEAD